MALDVFDHFDGHEQVVFGSDPATGLRCIIAVHSTALGPAIGGTRWHPYPDDGEALTDVLRLSKAMSHKAACAGLDHGGGKAVIIGDPATDRDEALLRAYARIIASLGGRYITACDVGTKPADMAVIQRETRWVTGMEPAQGGSGDSGVLTAWGVYVAIRACLGRVFGDDTASGRHVALQGVGKVGRRVAEHLAADGARLTVADVDADAAAAVAERTGAELAPHDQVHAVDADVFSPNALGAVLNDSTIPELRCKIVAGGANNQLAEDRHGKLLAEHGILYAPDYVANAGGLIQIADELNPGGYSVERAKPRVDAIAGRLHEVFALAAAEGVPTAEAADRTARRRMERVGRLRGFWLRSTE